jgi:hypothetical protein
MSSEEKKGISPEIIAALIGVAGTIAVAIFFNQPQSTPATPVPTPLVITATPQPTVVPTDTVPAGEPTSTPAPTDTPAPTPTEIPPVAIGEDWGQGCISTLWQPYPTTVPAVAKGNGCWQEPVFVFSANNGSLSFLYERNGNGPVETYGLFAPLPESGSVSFKIRLTDLDNVDVWMGIFSEPDIESNGLLMTIPAGNPKNRVIVQKDASNYATLQTTQNLVQGDGFSLTFTFNALSARGAVNPNVFVTNPVSIPSSSKWFFIGFRGLAGSYRVEGETVNFEIAE